MKMTTEDDATLPQLRKVSDTSAKRTTLMIDRDSMTKAQMVAYELVVTEQTYVSRLHLLEKIFHTRVEQENEDREMLPDSVVDTIFSNVGTIYKFHHDFLLPQLDKRLDEWSCKPRIGDLMTQFAPFLKLYTEYVRDFDKATNTLSERMATNSEFASLISKLQDMSECEGLALQHLMIEPIQRIPRYQLLLKDYLKQITENDDDYKDAKQALELVTEVATHLNDVMTKIDKFRRLVELNDQFGGNIDLSSPTRELIREGHVVQINAMFLEQQERYLFLFNDMVLLATEQNIGGKTYQKHEQLDIDGMKVEESDNVELRSAFYMKAKQKTLELKARTIEEKSEWIEAISQVITDFTKRKLSHINKTENSFSDEELGSRAPTLVRDLDTSMCMVCSLEFNLLRWRHHCRACGFVVCDACSLKRSRLEYTNWKLCRVCDHCHDVIESRHVSPRKRISVANVQRRSVLQVKASDAYFISDYLHVSADRGSTWCKRWAAVHSDFVLYLFKAHQDIAAETSLPLPGFRIKTMKSYEVGNRDHVFRISHHQNVHCYYLQARDRQSMERWLLILQKAVLAESP